MGVCKVCSNALARRCMGCMKEVYYCSKECQTSDWKKHKLDCNPRIPKSVDNSSPIKVETCSIEENTLEKLPVQMKGCQIELQEDSISAKTYCYKCESIPGKGIGMIALRDIRKGEKILQEGPIMCFDRTRELYEYFHIYNSQFKKLSVIEQNDVMKLHNARPNVGEGIPELNKVFRSDPKFKQWLGIMQTNKIRIDEESQGLYLETSKFNHCCVSNVQYQIMDKFNLRIAAIRDIKKGEELCYAYLSFDKSFGMPPTVENVKEYLKAGYGFDCNCELCSLKDKEVLKKIESHRVKYWKLTQKIENIANDISPTDLLSHYHDLFEHMENGKLFCPGSISLHATIGFKIALTCKQYEKADYYIKQAYNASVINLGDDHPMTKKYYTIMSGEIARKLKLKENLSSTAANIE